MLGAAAIAGLSVYWIANAYRKPVNKDFDILLARLEEMQRRLDRVEKWDEEKKSSNDSKNECNKFFRKDPKTKGKKICSAQRQQQELEQEQVKQRDESNKDDDSNANVLPPPYEEESSVYSPPQTIITKPKEDKAAQFLKGQDSVSHHSTRAQASTSSTSICRTPVPVVLISDPGQDLDDEMMFIMARHLVNLNLISLEGVIANLSPSFARARLTRGMFRLLIYRPDSYHPVESCTLSSNDTFITMHYSNVIYFPCLSRISRRFLGAQERWTCWDYIVYP
jgi:hypothetical protein